MKTRSLWRWVVPLLMPLWFCGCEDKEQTKRVTELEQEVESLRTEIQTLVENLRETEQQRDNYQNEVAEAKRGAERAERQASDFERQIEAIRKDEERRREEARARVTANPAEEAKKIVEPLLSALWVIEGERGRSRGIVAEADDKVWLYFPARALGGGSKLEIRDGAGTVVTQFGEFQIETGGEIARLEIKQEVETRAVIDPEAKLSDSKRLFFTNATATGAPKLDNAHAGDVAGSVMEYTAYVTDRISGCALFDGESGALLGITLPPPAADSVWGLPDHAQHHAARAGLLNREIEWAPAQIGALLTERNKLDVVNLHSRLLLAAAALRPGAEGLEIENPVPDANRSVREILNENKQMPGVQELFKLNDSLSGQRVKVSERDIQRQVSSVFGQMVNGSRRAAGELRSARPTPAHLQEAQQALEWNEEAEKKLAATLNAFGR